MKEKKKTVLGDKDRITHRFEFEGGSVCKFLVEELKNGKLEVTMVWEHPWAEDAHRSCFVLSKDNFNRMIDELVYTKFKGAKHEVFYTPQGEQQQGEEE